MQLGVLQSSLECCDTLGTSCLLSRTLTVFISLRVNLAVPWLSILPAYFLCMSSEEINLTEILRTCSFISRLSLLCSGCLPQNNEPLFLVCSGEECGQGLHTTSVSVVANYGASRIFSYSWKLKNKRPKKQWWILECSSSPACEMLCIVTVVVCLDKGAY